MGTILKRTLTIFMVPHTIFYIIFAKILEFYNRKYILQEMSLKQSIT